MARTQQLGVTLGPSCFPDPGPQAGTGAFGAESKPGRWRASRQSWLPSPGEEVCGPEASLHCPLGDGPGHGSLAPRCPLGAAPASPSIPRPPAHCGLP